VEASFEHLRDATICSYKLGFVTASGRFGLAAKHKMTDVVVRDGEGWKVVAHHGDLDVPALPSFNPLVPVTKGPCLGIEAPDPQALPLPDRRRRVRPS
jgi:hypothetical protein